MLICLIITLVSAVPGQAEFKTNDVSVQVDVRSSVYSYRLTNLSTVPVISFEVSQHVSYNFIVPQGWEKEVSSSVFRTWASNPQFGIDKNETAEFSLRVSSKGAVLGAMPAVVGFQSGKTVTVADVWAPVPEPRSYFALITGLILAIVIIHTLALVKKSRRAGRRIS